MVSCTAAATIGLALAVAATASASQLPTLTLAVTKNTIKVGGQHVSGAVQISTTVSGEAEDNPSLIMLKPGVGLAEFMHVVSKLGRESDFDAIDAYGTIVFSGADAPKGQTTTADTILEPGNYIAVNNGNGVAAFTVSKSSSPASLPAPQATVSAIDFGFRGADTLHTGELVRFADEGYLIHMFEAVPVASAADAKKAEADLLAGNVPAAKKFAIGAPAMLAGSISSGQQQESTITAAPGTYVLLCAMNTQDEREHFQLGMYRTITITK